MTKMQKDLAWLGLAVIAIYLTTGLVNFWFASLCTESDFILCFRFWGNWIGFYVAAFPAAVMISVPFVIIETGVKILRGQRVSTKAPTIGATAGD